MPDTFPRITFVHSAEEINRLEAGPSSIRRHHNALPGNLRHNIVVAEYRDNRSGRRSRLSGDEDLYQGCVPETSASGFDGYHPHLGRRTYVTREFRI